MLSQLFSIAMVIYAGAAVPYFTPRVIHEYRPDQYVAAALELFASITLLFWYVLRPFSSDD